MLPQISSFTVKFDKPYQVRLSLAGLLLFQARTGRDPFDLLADGTIGNYFVDLLFCLASVDHPELSYETVCATFTGRGLFRLADQLMKAGGTEPSRPEPSGN